MVTAQVWCCWKCNIFEAMKWILIYDSLMIFLTSIPFIYFIVLAYASGYSYEGFFILAIQVPRIAAETIFALKNYRRDWALICLTVRIWTLFTGLAATIAIAVQMIDNIIRLLDFAVKEDVITIWIVILISFVFISIDSYFCYIYKYYINQLDSRISSASKRIENMQILEMKYEAQNNQNGIPTSINNKAPYL